MAEPKMIRFIPSGKTLPYWDKYEFECIDCGSHYFSGKYNKRTRPYCAECSRKHDRERNKEYQKKKQEARDRMIRQQTIDEIYNKAFCEITSCIDCAMYGENEKGNCILLRMKEGE